MAETAARASIISTHQVGMLGALLEEVISTVAAPLKFSGGRQCVLREKAEQHEWGLC